MLLNVPNSTLLVAQPLCGVVPAELLDELPCAAGDVPREVDGVDSLEDDVVSLHGVGAGEGRGAWKKEKGANENIFSLVLQNYNGYIIFLKLNGCLNSKYSLFKKPLTYDRTVGLGISTNLQGCENSNIRIYFTTKRDLQIIF